jgi:hypothetical protein
MLPVLLLVLGDAQASLPDTMAREPVVYTIEATLDERAHVLRATERIEYRNASGLELTRLYLHLFPNAFRDAHTAYAREHARLPWALNPLDWIPWGSRRGFITIHSVLVGGMETAFTVHETVMEVPLSSPLRRGETLSIEIAFEVKLPVLQLALGYRGSSYAVALWHPKLAVPDSAGWRGDREPAEAAFYADCGSYDVRITAPSDVVVGATGEPADTTDNGDGTTTRRWRAQHVRYFAWVADRRYRVKHITWNDVAVDYLYVGRDDRTVDSAAVAIRTTLDVYSARYGRYPYQTLAIAETPALGSGVAGISYSQLVMLPAGLRTAAITVVPYRDVLAHEIAHQWWGMSVGVRDDRDDWLNEGFAEFSAWDLDRDWAGPGSGAQKGTSSSAYRRVEYLNQAGLGFDDKIVQPDSAFGGMGEIEVALYAKAPSVLRMLQHLVGPDTLDRILRAYASRYRYRTARTADFVTLANSVSERDLSWFFSEWLDSAATCDYSVDGITAVPRSDGTYRSVIIVRRNGDIVMPVDVELTLDDGSVLRRAWMGHEAVHQIVIDSAPRVRRAVLDPDQGLQETNRFNNLYPRRVRSSFLPRLSEDEAYHLIHLPAAFYDDGVELGLLLAGGRAPRGIPPTSLQFQHLAVVGAGYNLATKSALVGLAYSDRLALLGRRASWSMSVLRDGKRVSAQLSAGARFGPHLYNAPFHAVGVSLAHERRFETTPEFDQGTVNSFKLGYAFRGLVTDFYPLHGGMVAAEAEGGWKGLRSDWSFLRVAGRAEVYQRLLGGTKLALNVFGGTVAAGAAPRQKTLFLSREANFRAAQSDTVSGPHLTALNAELRVPVGTGTLLGVAGFVNLAKYWGSGPEAAGGLRREVGVGIRLLDNYGVQLDVPLWTADGAGTETLDFARVSLRVGRPFRGPGS